MARIRLTLRTAALAIVASGMQSCQTPPRAVSGPVASLPTKQLDRSNFGKMLEQQTKVLLEDLHQLDASEARLSVAKYVAFMKDMHQEISSSWKSPEITQLESAKAALTKAAALTKDSIFLANTVIALDTFDRIHLSFKLAEADIKFFLGHPDRHVRDTAKREIYKNRSPLLFFIHLAKNADSLLLESLLEMLPDSSSYWVSKGYFPQWELGETLRLLNSLTLHVDENVRTLAKSRLTVFQDIGLLRKQGRSEGDFSEFLMRDEGVLEFSIVDDSPTRKWAAEVLGGRLKIYLERAQENQKTVDTAPWRFTNKKLIEESQSLTERAHLIKTQLERMAANDADDGVKAAAQKALGG